jgi:hypothetical protein
MLRPIFFSAVLILLAALPSRAERWVRADLDDKSYRIDLDDHALIEHLTLRTALPAQVPEWLIPAGNVSEPVSVSTAAPFTAEFTIKGPVNDVVADFRQRLSKHGYAVTSIATDEPRILGNQPVQSIVILLEPNQSTTNVHITYTHHEPRDSGDIYLEAEAYDLSLKGLVVHDRASGCEFLIADPVLEKFNHPPALKASASVQSSR